MALSDLLNGSAFRPELNDIKSPLAIRMAGQKAVFAFIADDTVSLSIARFARSGAVEFGEWHYETCTLSSLAAKLVEYSKKEKGVAAVIAAVVNVGTTQVIGSGEPDMDAETRARLLRTGDSTEVRAVINDASFNAQPTHYYVPMCHKHIHRKVVFGWERSHLESIETALSESGLPLAAYISAPAALAHATVDAHADLIKSSDLLVRCGSRWVIYQTTEKDGDWLAVLPVKCGDLHEKENSLEELVQAREAGGESATRPLAVINLSPADNELERAAQKHGISLGETIGIAEAAKLCLHHECLALDMDLRAELTDAVQPLPKALAFLFWGSVFGGAASTAAVLLLGVMLAKSGQTKADAERAKSGATTSLNTIKTTREALVARLNTAETAALWLRRRVQPEAIVKGLAESFEGKGRVTTAEYQSSEGQNQFVVRVTIQGKPEKIQEGTSSFRAALQKLGYKQADMSEPVVADKVNFNGLYLKAE